MKQTLRYGDYLRTIGAGRRELSYIALVPPVRRDAQGRPITPSAPGPVQLHPDEIVALLRPYVSVRFMGQVKAFVPLALYLALFQALILRQLVANTWLITGGLLAVIAREDYPDA
jgi:hypothetical protein